MNKGLFALVVIFGLGLAYSIKKNAEITENWKTAAANMKAYDKELSYAEKKNSAYQLTIEQLKTFKDSILMELNTTREELKIKDKRLKSLQYVTSEFRVTDTLVLKDTVFKEPSVKVDTVLGNEWYKIKVGLKYPSEISLTPSFRSEKHIIVSNKKETVNPRKKFFIARWFQKKHYILQVDVIEKNPYTENEASKFIEVIK